MNGFDKLLKEDSSLRKDCTWCNETSLLVGQKTGYGAVIVYINGDKRNGWFVTLSPKTGGLEKDFTIQLMTRSHLTHFSQIDSYKGLAENFGRAFAKIAKAMTGIIAEEQPNFNFISPAKEEAVSVATYGKSTTWKEKKEHLHIKLFPFRGNIGQPYTVDSTFEKKEVHRDEITGEEFVKMTPIKKKMIEKERFEHLSRRLIELLK